MCSWGWLWTHTPQWNWRKWATRKPWSWWQTPTSGEKWVLSISLSLDSSSTFSYDGGNEFSHILCIGSHWLGWNFRSKSVLHCSDPLWDSPDPFPSYLRPPKIVHTKIFDSKSLKTWTLGTTVVRTVSLYHLTGKQPICKLRRPD